MSGNIEYTCGNEDCEHTFRIEYEISGGSPQTYTEPAEAIDVEFLTSQCPKCATPIDETVAEEMAVEDAMNDDDDPRWDR